MSCNLVTHCPMKIGGFGLMISLRSLKEEEDSLIVNYSILHIGLNRLDND